MSFKAIATFVNNHEGPTFEAEGDDSVNAHKAVKAKLEGWHGVVKIVTYWPDGVVCYEKFEQV